MKTLKETIMEVVNPKVMTESSPLDISPGYDSDSLQSLHDHYLAKAIDHALQEYGSYDHKTYGKDAKTHLEYAKRYHDLAKNEEGNDVLSWEDHHNKAKIAAKATLDYVSRNL